MTSGQLEVTLLGTGTSTGVPVPGCSCSVCRSDDRRNNRTRCSLLLTYAGKNILIDLTGGHTLWVHLKMTGHFYYRPSAEPIDKHDHQVFHLADNGNNLRFNDYRRFGRLRIYPTANIMEQKGLADLGPER